MPSKTKLKNAAIAARSAALPKISEKRQTLIDVGLGNVTLGKSPTPLSGGAAQRVQEDTMRFARTMEDLGLSFMRSLMTLGAFLPVLWTLSDKVTALPLIGAVPHSLVWVLLACVGVKLPGLEFHNQRVEAAYRKELVLGEDDLNRASPPTAAELFAGVRRNYFRLFFHYLYFDVVKWSYLQVSVLVPLVALGPTLIAGVITLGVMQQIARAFDKVLESFQFLVLNWSTVVEQISIYKRLRAFEQQMLKAEPEAGRA